MKKIRLKLKPKVAPLPARRWIAAAVRTAANTDQTLVDRRAPTPRALRASRPATARVSYARSA